MLLMHTSGLKAQVSSYAFSQSNGTYTPITGGAVLGTATNDDTGFNALNIGFSFVYNGTTYTQFSAQSNGFIALGATISSSYTSISTGTSNNVIAALNGDLQGNTTTGELRYETIGSAPNRTLVVQWTSYRHFGATGDDVNFQIQLDETTNLVHVVYGSCTQNATNRTREVGLRGTSNADFNNRTTASDWNTTTAGGTNAANCALTTAIIPASGLIFTWEGPPPTPPTPTQDPTPPTCNLGTNLDLAGPPPANVTWYWQTAANGTSFADAYAGPYTVFANGTYYARAYSSTTSTWSLASSSIVISNIPLATDPPVPTADFNPSCAPSGSILTAATAPVGYEFYWQGTTAGGTSNALNASSTYNAATSGTYYVAAYETATQCWSNTVGLAVTVDSYIPPAPAVLINPVNACVGAPSVPLNATPSATSGTATITFATNYALIPGTSVLSGNLAIPAGATITSSVLSFNGVSTSGSQWASDMSFDLTGASTYPNTNFVGTALTNAGPFNYNTTTSPAGGTVNLNMDNAWFSDGTFASITLTVNYSLPTPTMSWYDAASNGTNLGVGSPFESVGTSVLPNTSTEGSYLFYAGTTVGGCNSATRTPVTVNITAVLAVLDPVNVTCNGGDNGSFTLGAIQCGSGTFTYSVNGGPAGAIPTDLTAGTYTVIINDGALMSAPITVVITEPGVPTAGNATNVSYYNATLGWTTTGDETSWTVIYGTAGFDPATAGTIIPAATNPTTITGLLTEDTDYEFYVFSNCGPVPDTAGPFAFTTNAGFFTFDNACGPGFIDITSSGTALGLADDATTDINTVNPVTFQGVTSSTITVSNNGWLSFGAVTLNAWQNDWDDEEGNVYWQETTIGGDDYLIVEWFSRPRFPSVIGQNVTFEALINQTTGEVYYTYADKIVGGTQAANDNGGNFATISAVGPLGTATVSNNSTVYLTANSCVHFYNALCPNVTGLTALIYTDDAILDWNAGLYGETNWTLIYGPAGFDPLTSGTTLNLTSSDANFGSTLAQLTTYDVYIYSECQADNLTSPGLLYTFTTLPYCSIPSALAGTTDVDSLELTWNWTESSPTYPVTGFNISYVMGTNGTAYAGTQVVANGIDYADTVFDAALLAGGVYQVYVQALCAGTSDTSSYFGPITLIMPVSNDTVCGSENLAVDGTVYTFNNTGATVSLNEAPIAPPADGAQVTTGWTNSTLNNTTWFTFQAPASGSVRINNTAINYNGQAAVYEVTDCADFATFTLTAANDNEIDGTSLAPNFTICGLTPGATYYFMHDGFNATTGNYSVSISPIVLEAGIANPVTNICTGSNIDLFTTIGGNNAGGTWSSAIPSVNASITASDFNSNGLAYQIFDFQYRVIDGCAYDSIMSQVHVYPPSNAGSDGSIDACRNEPIDLLAGLTGTADLTGTWYDPSNNAIASSAIVTSNIPGQFNYDYIAGNGVCPNDTANVVVNVLANCNYLELADELFYGVSLFPNPSEGTVFIASDASQSFDYVITDANGRVIQQATNGIKATQTTEINLNNVETGIYFIRLSNEQAEKVFRVVVQ